MSAPRPLVGLAIDFDSIVSHLAGYGIISNFTGPDPACVVAIPRALDLLARLGVRATFFLVADAVRPCPALVRAIVEAGHEVACHSMTHPVPFAVEDAAVRRREIADAKTMLESLGGTTIAGFRAPSWDVQDALIDALLAAGYRYDASSFPSWTMLLLRRRVARAREDGAPPLAVSWRSLWGRRAPHLLSGTGGALMEIPMSTVPVVRLPYYHTMHHVLPAAVCRMLAAGAGRPTRLLALNYTLHAVDLLGLAEDAIDPQLGRHPGMNVPLPHKLALVEEAIRGLQRRGRVVPLATIADAAREGMPT